MEKNKDYFRVVKIWPRSVFIVLIISLYWILSELGVLNFNINLPWLPIIIAVISLGWIVGYYKGDKKNKN